MTITLTKRRLVLLALAVAMAWPLSLWAVGYSTAQFVRNSAVSTCELRGTPQLLINAGAWDTASAVRKATDVPGSLPAGDFYGESAERLRLLAAVPCEVLYPPVPLLPGLESNRPNLKPIAAPTPIATPTR